MSKRAGPPLFELLRERGETPPSGEPLRERQDQAPPIRAEPKPAERTEPKPKPAPASRGRETDSGVPWATGGVTRAERSAATFEDEPAQTGDMRISAAKVYTGIAVALALIVVAWVAGYRIGHDAGKAEMSALLPDDPVVNPPRQLGNSGNATQPNAGTPVADPGPKTEQEPVTQPIRPAPLPANWAMLADGLRTADPRVPGNNYLELATLPAEQASDALAYLASRGVRAIGSPVDSGARGDNNPSRYTLYSLGLAVPSGQYSTTATERRDHQALVASIGADWMRDRRGGSNFSQTLWRRYDP